MSSAHLILYITQYGYVGLFMVLGISILGIPIPDETLMVFIGFLVFQGKLNFYLAVAAAASGSIIGITSAYLLGSLFQRKVLDYLTKHAGSARLEKAFNWYHRHGGKLLTIGYFIPGVRHISGYVAGVGRLSYKSFAIFAYVGAVLWVAAWVSLGRLLGSRWNAILPIIHKYAIISGVMATILLLAFYLLYKNQKRLGSWLYSQLQSLPERYMSLGKRRILATVGGLLFLLLFIVLMGLVQDFITQEVGVFDDLVVDWLSGSSPHFLVLVMQRVNGIGTHYFILAIFVIIILLLRLSTKRWIHALPLILAWAGGTLIDFLF